MSIRLIKEVEDINRFREILKVLFEEGFDFLIEDINLKHKLPFSFRFKKSQKKHSHEKRLRLTLERLGPTFIKFGQVLSVRPDLVPKRYIEELEKLQCNVPQIPYSDVEKIIRKELGRNIKSVFSEFDKKPVASASISQVHRAVLKDGSEVAVKIQRPDVAKIMREDIEIMFYIAKLLDKHVPAVRRFNPTEIIEEFSHWTRKELDFRREALNARRFARNYRHDTHVKIPAVYKQLTTNKVLVMEYIHATPLHDVAEIKKKKMAVAPLLKRGFNTVLQQVFVHGFFHADPHPGNILVTDAKKIAFVDFGIVGTFSDELKQKAVDLFLGVIENDSKKVVDTLVDLSSTKVRHREELEEEVTEAIDKLQDEDVAHMKVSYVLEEVLDLALHYNVRVPAEFVLFGKTVVTLEGIALEYDPHFKIVENSKPFLKKILMQRYNPAKVMQDSMKNMIEMKKYLEKIPKQTSNALAKIERGSIHVDLEDSDIQKLSSEIDRSSNRVAYSMLVAALLIVGAMTVQFGNPIAFTLPLIPLLSFASAIVIGSVLLVSILRERNFIK